MPKFTDIGTISREEIEAELSYNSETGIFTWKKYKQGRKFDLVAGSTSKFGYKMVRLKNKWYYLHRLAWFLHFDSWPKEVIDHINRNPADNRIANLREATHSQNMANASVRSDSSTGVRGVTYHTATGKWLMRITKSFNTKEEAVEAFRKYTELLHDGFSASTVDIRELSVEELDDAIS